ncbi:hypothetical protein Tco_0918982, partial [Tanacetum coccineum]
WDRDLDNLGMEGKEKKYSTKNEELLGEYEEVFIVPTALPPKISHDHHISMVPNSPPISIRPYRHSTNQKVSIDSKVKELLESGVIRPSQSSFSSPIFMVKEGWKLAYVCGLWAIMLDYGSWTSTNTTRYV